MFSKRLVFLAMFAVLLSANFSLARAGDVNWQAFSVNLVKAIKSGHPGLQQSAMQHIIKYQDQLNVSDAIYDIAMIFRFDDNPRVRRLAMVTLYAIGNDPAVSYLCEYKKYLDDPSMERQCCWMITDYVKRKEDAKKMEITFTP